MSHSLRRVFKLALDCWRSLSNQSETKLSGANFKHTDRVMKMLWDVSNIFMSWPACVALFERKLFYFYFKILGEDSDLIQPNYHYGMIHYALSGLFGIFWPKMARMCSLGGIGALFFFSYAMYDIGALCIACIIGKVRHSMALFSEYQRYMLHDLYPLWDLIVITEPFQRSYCESTALLYWFYPIRIEED